MAIDSRNSTASPLRRPDVCQKVRWPLVLLWRTQVWRREVWMILQILLPRLVSPHHSESARRIHVDGSLQIQLVERNYVLDGSITTLLNHGEMYVPVHKPVVDRTIHCAVMLIERD